MGRRYRGGGQGFEHEVAVGHAIERIGGRAIETERFRREGAVDRKGGAGERRSAERTLVEPRAGVTETAAIAENHLDIGEEMVAEGHRLGGLQMGEAGHDGIGIGRRLFHQRQLQISQLEADPVDGVAHPELEIERHLIVARTRRMQSPRRGADQFRKTHFDIHVNVFESAGKDQFSALDFARHLV